MTPDELNNNVHKALQEAIWEAVQTVAELEETWSPEEMTKRIVRYLYKSSTAENLTSLPWKQAINQFVEKAANSYSSACHEKPWYAELDITPALGMAGWQVAEACGGFPRPTLEQVQELAATTYKDRLEKAKVEKVLWDWLQTNFPADEKVLGKLFKALNGTYGKAYDSARAVVAKGEVSPVEHFVTQWMRDSMGRVWEIPDREILLTEDTVTELFTGLATPGIFGDEDPNFSCIPSSLSEGQEYSLDFVRGAFEAMVQEWENPPETAASAKRRKKEEEGEDAVEEEAV
jgi:hypothetical protein